MGWSLHPILFDWSSVQCRVRSEVLRKQPGMVCLYHVEVLEPYVPKSHVERTWHTGHRHFSQCMLQSGRTQAPHTRTKVSHFLVMSSRACSRRGPAGLG